MREGSSSERLEGVELLRFVLAFGVVIYHYYYFGPHMRLIALPPIDGIGLDALMFGVEAFFAVSGLVILISTARRSAIDFLIARIARLGPTLLVASSFTPRRGRPAPRVAGGRLAVASRTRSAARSAIR